MQTKTVKINPNSDRLWINILFHGVIMSSYIYILWEAQSNYRLDVREGNNQNPDDDKYLLPLPTGSNQGRLIDVRTRFIGIDSTKPKYKIIVEIYQGKNKLDEVFVEGNATGGSQYDQLFMKLI